MAAPDFSTLPDKAPEMTLETLFEAGCHFGHQASKWHPSMKEWIYTEKDGVHIIDLAKTATQLKLAYNLAYDLGKSGKTLVVVGTKRQARDVVKAAATDAGAYYITSRWLGGLLTNWEQVGKSLKRMIQIEEGLKTDAFKGYTKFERVQMEKEQTRLGRFFEGIKTLKKAPDFLFVIDPGREKNVLKEAQSVGVPIMALIDTNSDSYAVDLPIPANDDALASLTCIIEYVLAGFKAGKAAA
jgi:small subunit ribosomal protein S2